MSSPSNTMTAPMIADSVGLLQPRVNITIHGTVPVGLSFSAFIDTGADETMMPEGFANTLGVTLGVTKVPVHAANGSVLGMV